ncbi:Murein DD-endopeptidase MepM and murein hydrolase activator NlpD, contain LysM domain [Paenibacillus sp. 1_12]|uniref:peptidoglycan DD-metalloendopeptidase family protein n=1 Tax=Paenibacillus sp. 1_12 TaxID=1566278 RepID=UPI0008E4475A|nr:M23 family metallopeptidase [Paenibacillus sp. 1_12]SFL97800.1 Murein DD-endopeptidase MepM and murein hydrolase activator NlpD, contain LysM domain [Paenibacillus sp. 1_12]
MSVLKGMSWAKELLDKSKQKLTKNPLRNMKLKLHLKSAVSANEQSHRSAEEVQLIESVDTVESSTPVQVSEPVESNETIQLVEKSALLEKANLIETEEGSNHVQAAETVETAQVLTSVETEETIHKAKGILGHKWTLIKTAAVASVITAVVWGGNHYIVSNMNQVYHVFVNGTEIGVVSDKSTVEQFEASKVKELASSKEDLRMVVQEPTVTYTAERAFMAKSNDKEVLDKIVGYISAYPIGTELLVDGKNVGVLKNKETANQVLEQIKTNVLDKKKDSSKVRVLSAAAPVESGELQKIEFVQKVELHDIPIQPQDVVNPDELRKKLETGDVQPVQYTVVQGDCVSCIATKLNISKQVIYQNNPTIVDDKLKVGQKLDLTVLQPTLAVRTVEKVVENQEIQFDTEFEKDSSVMLGTDQTLRQGKNGLKKITILVTKVNGLVIEEAVQGEEVIEQPVKALVRKGTKVITGQGTGKFAWPVQSYSITSTFGYRWGALHKGLDLTSPNKTILASDNGKVVYASYDSGYGNHVILDHMNGYKTLYGHMSQIYVKNGQIVEKGEKIGYMGSTGNSTGVHLHFEVQKNDVAENPSKYLNR